MTDHSWIWPVLFSLMVLVGVAGWTRSRWADDGLASILLWALGIFVSIVGWLGWLLGSTG